MEAELMARQWSNCKAKKLKPGAIHAMWCPAPFAKLVIQVERSRVEASEGTLQNRVDEALSILDSENYCGEATVPLTLVPKEAKRI